MNRSSRRLIAIVFTDIVGYSAIVHRDERLGERLLKRQRQLIRRTIPRFNGREVSTAGDGFLLQFGSALAAVEAVIAIQQGLAQDDIEQPDEMAIVLRASVHLGDVEHRDGDLYGDGVNIAARLLPLSPPRGLALSSQALSMIRQRLELPLRSLGTPPLKNIDTPVEVFALEAADLLAVELQPADSRPAWLRAVSRSMFRRTIALAVAAVTLMTAVLLVVWQLTPRADTTNRAAAVASAVPDKSIAVLPFANMSEDKANGYFADGMQDEILTALAKIKSLKVVSRTSTEQFRGTKHRLADIGAALGVATVLEGSVQRIGDRVRINVQLIRARTDDHLWAESYDRDLSDLFAVQSEVARGVADALHAQLLPAEQKAMRQLAVPNARAHDLYLQASQLERRGDDVPRPEDMTMLWPRVVSLYQQALAQEPKFALAAAAIGRVQMRLYYFGGHEAARLAEAHAAVERALQLDPALAEAQVALGLYRYWGHRDYAEARKALESARSLKPSDADVHGYLGAIARRQGRWDEAIASLRQAVVLDPTSAGWWQQLAIAYRELDRWHESEAAGARLLELANDPDHRRWWQAYAAALKSGDLTAMRAFLAGLEPGSKPYHEYALNRSDASYLLRDFDAALAALDEVEDQWIVFADGEVMQPKSLRRGMLHYLKGEQSRAQGSCADALQLVDIALRERPEESASHFQRAYALVCLARPAEAIDAATRGASLMPISRDALAGANALFDLASVLALAGAHDRAIGICQQLVSVPSDYSKGWLRIDPQLDALRGNARFEALLAD